MAPSTTQKRRSPKYQQTTPTSSTRRIITRSIYKKEKLLLSSQESPKKVAKFVESSSFCKEDSDYNEDSTTIMKNINDICSTPKSEKHKIPEIVTCPPAPKKPKNINFLNQKRRPITFFAHPDIEKFFTFAMRDIKV